MPSDDGEQAMPSDKLQRADRVLVWLWLLTLIFGGLATTAVVFGANAVIARVAAPVEPADASDHTEMHPASPTSADDHTEMHPASPTSTDDHTGMHPATSGEGND